MTSKLCSTPPWEVNLDRPEFANLHLWDVGDLLYFELNPTRRSRVRRTIPQELEAHGFDRRAKFVVVRQQEDGTLTRFPFRLQLGRRILHKLKNDDAYAGALFEIMENYDKYETRLPNGFIDVDDVIHRADELRKQARGVAK